MREPHEDFLLNKQLHGQIQKVFGKELLNYSLSLSQGKFHSLLCILDNIIL